jgi:lycopene beta-cyclase
MDFDYVLVGGGLQSGLIALALRRYQPEATVAIVERSETLGGNHTWSFHDTDIPAEMADVVAPLVVQHWEGHEIRFPAHVRRLAGGYATITSSRLHEVVTEMVATCEGSTIFFRTTATETSPRRVRFSDSECLSARWVIDARGPLDAPVRKAGFQKFVGLELQFDRPTGPQHPILMDATVPQKDGFRFVYTLPLSPERLLVEDTYYSNHVELDVPSVRERVLQYAQQQGWTGGQVVRAEHGVLPIPWKQELPQSDEVLQAGYRGGWFHPTTGYSVPIACRLALAIATAGGELPAAFQKLRSFYRGNTRFCHLLNWMLFRAYEPNNRFRVLERFYRLPEPTIQRFYSLTMIPSDRARILCGTPPRGFSVRSALSRMEMT